MQQIARNIRKDIIRTIQIKGGHTAINLSTADILTALYFPQHSRHTHSTILQSTETQPKTAKNRRQNIRDKQADTSMADNTRTRRILCKEKPP
ncbi:MAG: hypothetical protein NTW67_04695 [Candidatus Woesearchaeota archaeon]|nr:hypothetical protein [Candidatus Woesearchaeota archaeon]